MLGSRRFTPVHSDLNLLTALDALLEEGGVTAAADRLHLSAPAMSRTLGRLRRATGDEILVRTGRTMTPTPRALALREEVHALVHRAHAVLAPEGELDLAALERTFTLRCHDALATALGPRLVTAVVAAAPGVRLRILPEGSADDHDLRRGDVDLEVGAGTPALPDVRSETLGHGRLVVAAGPGLPDGGTGLTVERYAAALHVTVSRRGRLRDPVDEALAALGLARRVVAAAPTTAAALQMARDAGVLVVVPEHACRPALEAPGLRALAVPLDLAPVPVVQSWHQRYDGDPAHRWLRGVVRGILRADLAAG